MGKFTYDPYAYELQATREVGSLDSVTDSIHWAQVPEKMLLDSGYIVDIGSHRTERLRNGGFRDYGLDALARCADGSYIGVQAKAYGHRSTITASCLGTFQLAITFMREKNPLSRGVLIHTPEARIENRLRIAIDRGMGGITHKSLPFAEPVDAVDPGLEMDDCELVLRPYQKRALEDIITSNEKIGLYVSPCGTGKTVVVGTALRTLSPDVVVVASPLQFSAEQNANRLAKFLPGHALVKAWSDEGTTTVDEVQSAIQRAGARVLVSTTFDTLPIVARVCGPKMYLVVDEAHNLPPLYTDGSDSGSSSWSNSGSSSDESDSDSADTDGDLENVHPLWSAIYSADRTLAMTATPPSRLVEDNPDIVCVHTYTFAEAIQDKAICDYRIYIPEITPRGENGEATRAEETSTAAKAAFLASGMLESGSRRCIVFCESVNACRAFSEAFAETCETYFGVGYETGTITCENSRSDRVATLHKFRTGTSFETRMVPSEIPDEEIEERKTILRIVTAVRILDEAIDIPECDSVFFTRVSGTTNLAPARAVQRLCRAMRIHPWKTLASAFVWTLGGDAREESGLVEMFSLLRENDLQFANKTVVVSRDYDSKGGARALEASETTIADFQNRFIARALAWEEVWARKVEDVRSFVAEKGRLPKRSEKPLGTWIVKQRHNFKKGKLPDDRIAALESIAGWRWDPFSGNLVDLTAFVAEKGRLPKTNEKPLGVWIHNQRKSYKKGRLPDDRIASLEAVPGWKWEVEDPFPETLADLTAFVAEKGRLPKRSEKPLGEWITTQRHNFKKGKLPDDRIAALEAVPGWEWEVEDPFPGNLADLTAFVAEKGRLPKFSEKPLGAWITTQRHNYKKKKLSDDYIAALAAVPGWKWEVEDPFPGKLADLTAFVAEKGCLPKRSEKPLGWWINRQRTIYKKKLLSDDRITALEAVPGWRWSQR